MLYKQGLIKRIYLYLCVRPEYQKKGIGKELLGLVKNKYKNYLYLILIAENKQLGDRHSVIRRMLREFPGAIISISHDRKYIEEVCQKGLLFFPPSCIMIYIIFRGKEHGLLWNISLLPWICQKSG